MTSYTIDPSIFEPPLISKDDNYKNELIDFFKIINICYNFIRCEGISVYIFHYVNNYFNDDYVKKAKLSGPPVDMYKRMLDDIYLFNIPEIHYGEKTGHKKYYFEDWFEIEISKCEKSNIKPSLQKQQDDESEFCNRINMIGILNNIVLKDSQFHYLVRKENFDNLFFNSQNINFSIKNINNFKESLSAEIRLKQINNLDFDCKIQYNSVIEVFNRAKELFHDHIIFGNDVGKGIRTIRDSAGPPDRIFAYLETLVEFCELKRAKKANFSDDYILQALGCICSYEDEDSMKNEEFKKARMFDNGDNENMQFNMHLKPNTFRPDQDADRKKRTVRIYITWDDIQKKIIVGWIGKHP